MSVRNELAIKTKNLPIQFHTFFLASYKLFSPFFWSYFALEEIKIQICKLKWKNGHEEKEMKYFSLYKSILTKKKTLLMKFDWNCLEKDLADVRVRLIGFYLTKWRALDSKLIA